MKKIMCKIELFDVSQNIYIVDTETGDMDYVATTTFDTIDKTLATLSYSKSIPNIVLMGATGFSEQLATNIINYSKTTYGEDKINLEIEVK